MITSSSRVWKSKTSPLLNQSNSNSNNNSSSSSPIQPSSHPPIPGPQLLTTTHGAFLHHHHHSNNSSNIIIISNNKCSSSHQLLQNKLQQSLQQSLWSPNPSHNLRLASLLPRLPANKSQCPMHMLQEDKLTLKEEEEGSNVLEAEEEEE
jgi:hypothetical protein